MKRIADGGDREYVLVLPHKQELRQALRDARERFDTLIAEYIVEYPTLTHQQIADRFDIPRQKVAMLAARYDKRRKHGAGSTAAKAAKA